MSLLVALKERIGPLIRISFLACAPRGGEESLRIWPETVFTPCARSRGVNRALFTCYLGKADRGLGHSDTESAVVLFPHYACSHSSRLVPQSHLEKIHKALSSQTDTRSAEAPGFGVEILVLRAGCHGVGSKSAFFICGL